MRNSSFVLGGVVALVSLAASQSPPSSPVSSQVPVGPAHRDTVFITKSELDKAATVRASGATTGLASLGAVRAGDDRINVDVLQRSGPREETPVSHKIVPEIYYILEGGGEIETGGEIPNPQPMTTPSGEPVNPANIGPSIRGEKMIGGATRHIAKGDVVMIPPNVPHRFKALDGSITYIVVRVNPGYEKGK
ncbi:MAG TPA: AraC family ligand binding domain-containing protein [Steroidobacteraceae bacterium]|nr:AraC family ligand binding domain-containing protein [Steroidobacteraceae bacterium]